MTSFLRRENLFLFISLVLHLAITLPLAAMMNLWLDEAWTMQTTAHGAVHALPAAIAEERQAPLYFVLLAIWREADDSLFFARLFSIVCTALAIVFFHKLIKYFFTNKESEIFTVFFAVHPFLLSAALDARVYGLAMLLTTLLLWLWAKGYADEEKRTYQAVYILVSVAALYTNYYLGFLLVGNAAALLVLRKWKALASYLAQMFLVALLIVPLVWIIKQQFSVNSNYYRAVPNIVEGLAILWSTLNHFLLPAPDEETFRAIRLWIVRFLVLGFAGILLATVLPLLKPKNYPQKLTFSRQTLAFGAICAVVLMFLLAAYFLIGVDYVEIRHTTVLFVPFMLWLGSALLDFGSRRVLGAAGILLMVFYSASIYQTYSTRLSKPKWEATARFIEKNEQPNQPIFVFHIYETLSVDYYYNGANKIFPQNVLHDWNGESAQGTPTRFKRQIEYLIQQIPPESEKIWLVKRGECTIECRPLEDFVIENYVVEKSENLFGSEVRLLKRK